MLLALHTRALQDDRWLVRKLGLLCRVTDRLVFLEFALNPSQVVLPRKALLQMMVPPLLLISTSLLDRFKWVFCYEHPHVLVSRIWA